MFLQGLGLAFPGYTRVQVIALYKKKKIEIVWYTHIHSSVNNTLKISSMRNLIFMNEKANQKIKLNFLEKSVGT
jgi:hypothetical protein